MSWKVAYFGICCKLAKTFQSASLTLLRGISSAFELKLSIGLT